MKSELIAELHIPKRSASRDLAFAIEHGVKTAEFVDDDAEIVATCDLSASFQQLIDDCERDLRRVNGAITLRDQINVRLDAGNATWLDPAEDGLNVVCSMGVNNAI